MDKSGTSLIATARDRGAALGAALVELGLGVDRGGTAGDASEGGIGFCFQPATVVIRLLHRLAPKVFDEAKRIVRVFSAAATTRNLLFSLVVTPVLRRPFFGTKFPASGKFAGNIRKSDLISDTSMVTKVNPGAAWAIATQSSEQGSVQGMNKEVAGKILR